MTEAGPRPPRRVAITGLGVVAPNGIGKEAFWHACISGLSGIRSITRFDASALPSRIAGEVTDFAPAQLGLTPDEYQHVDRGTQFAIAAANMASAAEGEGIWRELTDNGTRQFAPLDTAMISASLLMPHASAACIAAHHHLHGPSMVIATGCSAGADAIGQAYWAIQEERVDRMLAGGADSAISPLGVDVFCVMGALSTRFNEEPQRASRPYDALRDGFVMAEGAAVLLLEDLALARARGAHIYAEIIAFTSNSNAHHMTALPANGAPLQQLLRQAMQEADIEQQQLDYINSHGSSTPPNELAETAAYKAVFGDYAYKIPISATKSMIGHTQGAASAIEAAVTALAIDQQIIPPTLNQEQSDPACDLDYVPGRARPTRIDVALTHSSGFGGVNSALIFARPDWTQQHGR